MRLLAGLALSALLSGCAPTGPDTAFEDYLSRLSRTLSLQAPGAAAPATPTRPRPGEIRVDIEPGKLDALDFLALRGCALQVTVGKRNSSLGRMARDSQRLLLELEFLRLAPQCVVYQETQGRVALADQLEQAWHLKRRQLPALIFNATLGSTEYRDFWHEPVNPGDYPAVTSSAVIAAARAINSHARRWLAGDYRAENRAFEILLSEVAKGDGGALLQALARQAAWLESANLMLEQRMALGPLCAPRFTPAAADILANVVRKYFIGAIQPRSAALGRRYHELLPAITELEQLLGGALPANYRAWQSERDTLLTRLAQAPRQHAAQIKAIQRPCTQP